MTHALTKPNHLLRAILAFALVFAAWHVTQHEIAFNGHAEAHEECQVCRLTHTPTAEVDVAPSVSPLFILQQLIPITVAQLNSLSKLQTHHARAPPAH